MNVLVGPANIVLSIGLPTTLNDKTTAIPSGDLVGINVYRTDGSAAAKLVGKADISTSPATFKDPSLAVGEYGYQAAAVDQYGVEGDRSDVFPVTIIAQPAPIAAPTIVSVTTGT